MRSASSANTHSTPDEKEKSVCQSLHVYDIPMHIYKCHNFTETMTNLAD